MGKLIVTELVTLDGVAQAPGGPGEDEEGDFAYGGWQVPLLDSESTETMFELASSMGALVLGRKTYETFAGYWPTASQESPFASLVNRVPKHVASHSLEEPLDWQNSTLLTGDLAESVTALKQRHNEVQVIGSPASWLRGTISARFPCKREPAPVGRLRRAPDQGTSQGVVGNRPATGSPVRLKKTGRRHALVVPLHRELRRGTLAGILRDADLSAEDLRQYRPTGW